ncbi:MSMEG_0565 family glycosyltransferase [Labrys sp. ZIDIC5]|uniref:MSMEG_0565 family glycosyltransferase n=1 Tax=Labrys sedimenti TaxID=3106036 RepID=UPI002ACA885C|nr:MSMEG_0565 family glycosyltransferase [Labrys sp. ZIDIC5]MDZ5454715.1 MSMEG_0565 family glycosyltransferase [Labrys sp. ZIDIC5]
MSIPGPLRIAILTHSTNPRGGVVHALALGEALTALGHEAVVHAPDAKTAGFFRKARCETACVPASPFEGDIFGMVETRVADYLRYFGDHARRRFDVFHAHDGISGNALATLRRERLIASFARTVHHVDSFEDPRVAALQARSIHGADRHFAVSEHWRRKLDRDMGIAATMVGNGVDTTFFQPEKDGTESGLARRLGLGRGPVFLSVGGVEERKNTLRILQAFSQVQTILPDSQLVLAGGASVLDHAAYQAEFRLALDQSRMLPGSVVLTGPVPQAEMAALYRISSALAFPSLKEGFGLAVIEAMACGIPVIASHIPPFSDYLADGEVVWCDPMSTGSIADAMIAAIRSPQRERLAKRGPVVATRHNWADTARAHLPVYRTLGARQHA